MILVYIAIPTLYYYIQLKSLSHPPTHAHTHIPPTHTPPTGTRQTSVLVVKLHLQLYEMYTQEHNLLDFKSVTWPHTNFGMTSINFFVEVQDCLCDLSTPCVHYPLFSDIHVCSQFISLLVTYVYTTTL